MQHHPIKNSTVLMRFVQNIITAYWLCLNCPVKCIVILQTIKKIYIFDVGYRITPIIDQLLYYL